MIKIRFTICILCIIIAFTSCQHEELELKSERGRQVLVYMIADNNLDYFAVRDINEMERGMGKDSDSELFVYIDRGVNGKPSHPYLLKIISDTTENIVSKIILTYPEQNSADPKVLEQVIKDVSEISKNKNPPKGLVLWSHGNAWLPPAISLYSDRDKIIDTTTNVSSIKSFGYDETLLDTESGHREMDIIELAETLSPYHFDFILFDACYMGTIEVAYELKDVCNYIICSPTEILSDGFPYDKIVNKLFSQPLQFKAIAEDQHSYYNSQKGILKSAAICVVKTDGLDNLSTFFNNEFTNSISNISIEKKNLSYTKDSLQQFDRLGAEFLFDMEDFVSRICKQKNKMMLLNEFHKCWHETVIYEKHTKSIVGSLELKSCNGLSIYIPQNYPSREKIKEYYKKLSWYEASNSSKLFLHFK